MVTVREARDDELDRVNELRKQVNGNSARRRVTTDAEYLAELRRETFFAKLSLRISRMVTAIAKADHERWKRQQQRCSATSNDPQATLGTVEQYEMLLMMKRNLTIGEA